MSSYSAHKSGESPVSPSHRGTLNSQNSFSSYDSSHRPASQRQYISRRSSATSSITSLGGALDGTTQSHPNPIKELGNNAISTLLQPPIVRTGLVPHSSGPSAPKPPSSKDIPPVTLTGIPRVDNSLIRNYINQASSLYDVFRRGKEESDEGRSLHSRRESDEIAGTGLAQGMQRRLSGTPSLARTESSPSAIEGGPQLRRRSSGGNIRRAAPAVAPLSTIPNVYFEEDFHLENPRTFDIVSEKSEIARPPGMNGVASAAGSTGRKALAANAILQEKLSWYMDTVEIHLISSISTASTSFFAALGSLRELHAEAADSVEKIKILRQDLISLDKGMAIGGLKVVEKRRRRENMRKLGDAVQQLEEVVRSVSDCEEQVDQGQIKEALVGLAEVERLIAGEIADVPEISKIQKRWHTYGRLIDLRGIKALSGATNDIAFLRRRIGKAYEVKFMETLLQDLRRHVDSVPATSTFRRWNSSSSRLRGQHASASSEIPAYLHVDSEFRSLLLSHLKGLARSDSIMSAALSYKEAILRELKNLIRRHLPSSNEDDVESTTSIATHDSRSISSQEKSSILAKNLRGLDSENAEDMFKKIYSNVGEALRRLGTQVKVLLDITSSLGAPPPGTLRSPPRSPQVMSIDSVTTLPHSPGTHPSLLKQEEIQQVLDLSSLLGQAVDICQAQITKVLKVRKDQTTRLEIPYFMKYFTLNRLFADECEAVSGRGGSSLKNIVQDHIKTFIGTVAESEKQRLIQRMDADKWEAKDFSEEHKQRLDRIIDSATKDVEQWTKLTLLWGEEQEDTQVAIDSPATNGNADPSSKEKVRSASVDEVKYILSISPLAFLDGMEVFERMLTGIPSMGTDISSSILEYMKLFNSRSSQLILGAGATKSAGLKHITTKHLTLSSQSLSFVAAIIPYIREFARRHLPSSSAMMGDFDKVKRLYQDHQLGIQDKLVDIMTNRSASLVNNMKKIDWEGSSGQDSVGSYMETLMKDTVTLQRVLTRHLPDSSVRMIMAPVISNYRDQWSNAFGGAILKTLTGKERLLRDAEFFRSRISKIDGAGDVGDAIYSIAQQQPVESATIEMPDASSSESGKSKNDEDQTVDAAKA